MQFWEIGFARAALTLAVTACALGTLGAQAAVLQTPPASIAAGPFAVTPTLGTEVKYRDNIYLQERNETNSWIYLLRPAVTAVAQDRNNIYQLGYQGETAWYEEDSNNDENNYSDNTISGDAHMEFAERWEVEGYASWADLHEDRGTGLTEGVIGNFVSKPVEYDQTDVGGSVQYGSEDTVGRVLVELGYMEREYQNFRDFTRTRDRDETTFGTTFFYPVAPNTDAFVEYDYKDIDYPNAFLNGPPLDSEENSLWLGAEWEITPNMTSTASVGYVDKDFDSSGRDDWDGGGWSVELWMQPRDRDTLLIQTSRKPEETSLQGDFIMREILTAQWTHDWSDRIYTEVTGTIGEDNFKESVDSRKDDIYGASLTVGYEFRRWANAYVGYEYDDKDANVNNLSYTDHVFMVGVDFSL